MTVDIALYRARIGLFNRYKHVKSTILFYFLTICIASPVSAINFNSGLTFNTLW